MSYHPLRIPYPLNTLHILKKKGIKLKYFLNMQKVIQNNDMEMLKSARCFCTNCTKVSNTNHTQCTCGANLIKRDFDDPETTKTRINFYRTNIEPFIEKIKELYPSYFFNTECSIEECYVLYQKLMAELSSHQQ